MSVERARALFAEEFPTLAIDRLWLGRDGRGAVARSSGVALVLLTIGDGYVARKLPWAEALAANFADGVLRLNLGDVATSRARVALDAWPPADVARGRA